MSPASILIVVSDEARSARLVSALSPDSYTFKSIQNLEYPLPLTQDEKHDLAIIWFPYASPDALPTLENIVIQIQELEQLQPLPVLLIIDQYGAHWVEPGFHLGVTDILTRPIHPLVLRQRVRLILSARQTELAMERLRQSELALRREQERFKTVADFTYDWEYWSDDDGRLIYNSPSCERITGLPAQSFIHNPHLLHEIVHPADQKAFNDHTHQERSSREPLSIDFRVLAKDGEERWIGHVCQPVFSDNGSSMGRRSSNRDITERKLADQRLLRAERLAVMGRLIASLAHEINNPLQAVCANLDLVTEFHLDAAEHHRYLQVIRQEIERLMAITRGILDFSRPAVIEKKITDIYSIIERASLLAKKQLMDARVNLQLSLTDNLPLILASPDELVQVCLNLMINAIEHTPDGGTLEICAQPCGEELEITFSDTGCGISADEMEMIFEPFFSTKKDGTGLGLAICQNIIHRHNGSISVRSQPYNGSTFRILLPAYSDKELTPDDDPLT